MSRLGRKDLEGLVGRIMKLEGRPETIWEKESDNTITNWHSNVGAIELGHDAYGWHVGEINNEHGGVRNWTNGNAAEVYAWLSGYAECLWRQATKEGAK